MVVDAGRQAKVWVCFKPAYCLDRTSEVVDKVPVEAFSFSSASEIILVANKDFRTCIVLTG